MSMTKSIYLSSRVITFIVIASPSLYIILKEPFAFVILRERRDRRIWLRINSATEESVVFSL